MYNNQFITLNAKQIRFLLLAVILFMIIGLFFYFLLRVDGFRITNLHINSDNASVEVSDGNLYAFNGAVFYKKSLINDSPIQVLGGGQKLPVVKKAFWAGNKGVVLSFDQSFIDTPIPDIAKKKKLSYSQQGSSMWYYNFNDNTLSHLDSTLAYGSIHYFSKTTNTVSYLTRSGSAFTLKSYSTATNTLSIIPIPANFDNISQLLKCPGSDKLCVVGSLSKSPQTTGLYVLESNRSTRALITVDGRLYAVPDSQWMLVLDRTDGLAAVGEGTIPVYKHIKLINIKTKEQVNSNTEATADSFLYSSYDNDKIVLLHGNNDNTYTTLQGFLGGKRLAAGSLHYTDGSSFTSAIVLDSNPTPDVILFKSTDGNYNLFATNDYVKAETGRLSESEAENIVRSCTALSKNISYRQNNTRFTIFVPEDNNQDIIHSITNCLGKRKAIYYGYDFWFTTIDPATGKQLSY